MSASVSRICHDIVRMVKCGFEEYFSVQLVLVNCMHEMS